MTYRQLEARATTIAARFRALDATGSREGRTRAATEDAPSPSRPATGGPRDRTLAATGAREGLTRAATAPAPPAAPVDAHHEAVHISPPPPNARSRPATEPRAPVATLCVTPGPDAVATLFALWKAGCVAVPLHERLTPSEIAYARQTVNSSFHIDNHGLHIDDRSSHDSGQGHDLHGPCGETTDQYGPRKEDPAPVGSPRADHAVPSRPTRRPADQARPARLHAARPNVVAFVLTSGSTGPPRAFGFTHRAFAASAAAVASRLGLGPGDRWGLCLSPGHIGGLSLIVRAVVTGASVRLWPSFDADAVCRAILAGEVTHLAVVPVMLRRILARLGGRPAPESLRCVLVGGASASRALLDRAWTAGLPVATTWGMTETASQVATAPPAVARRRPGTAGRPLRGVEVRPGPGGTLQVRGPTLARVVIHGPGATPQPLPADPDGWFSTRDVGRVGEDGLVWIEGRADAIIVSGGLNVSPEEVERVIEALPGVREAVVVGVPDEEWGETVAAAVEADPAAVVAADVDRHCRERLVRGRCPSRIVVVDALPRTLTGKAVRSRAAALLDPRASAASSGHGTPARPDSSRFPKETK